MGMHQRSKPRRMPMDWAAIKGIPTKDERDNVIMALIHAPVMKSGRPSARTAIRP